MWESIKEKIRISSPEDLVLGFIGASFGMCLLGLALLIFIAAIRYAVTGS